MKKLALVTMVLLLWFQGIAVGENESSSFKPRWLVPENVACVMFKYNTSSVYAVRNVSDQIEDTIKEFGKKYRILSISVIDSSLQLGEKQGFAIPYSMVLVVTPK